MIKELTEEQQSLLSVYRDKWIEIGLSTEPLNLEKSMALVSEIYQIGGLKPPQHFFSFPSPFSAVIGIAAIEMVYHKQCQPNKITTGINADVRQAIELARDQAVVELGLNPTYFDRLDLNTLRETADEYLRGSCYGSVDAHWLGFYDFMNQLVDCSQLVPQMELAKHCGWWIPLGDICVLQDRPESILRDELNRLHNDSGPAIRYRDGFSVYSWHGTRFPGEWLIAGKLTPTIALTHSNNELRRVACEILGWHTILKELDSVVINKNEDPEIGTLYEVELPNDGRERFLSVQCGTGRQFVLPVPPTVSSAAEANAWTYGLAANDYNPEVRT